MLKDEASWKPWATSDDPENQRMPEDFSDNLTDFQQLCILRCFRVDRVYNGVTNFVIKQMGQKFVMPPVVELKNIHEQSSPKTPIIFLISPGSDPASSLAKLAEDMGFAGNKLKYLSLGQGKNF